jgi:hypothetical protein
MIPKRIKNNWSNGGKPGQFRLIDKHALSIDGRYQRDQVSENKVREIARSWDWVLLGALMVVKRNDGSLWVFDGGHRTRASFYRDDVTLLPCMVYEIDDLSNEAKAFLGKNLMITNVRPVDKYKAAVCAEDEIAKKAENLLSELGIKACQHGTTSKSIRCINTLMSMIECDEHLARRCFIFCLARTDGEIVSSQVLRGLFTLCQHFADQFDVLELYGEKLARHSQREMGVRIRQTRAETGKGGERIEALALLSLINKGCKKKLSW